MSQTRRLAAILAADVAGYSRLMGADEEGTHERLKALRRELLDPKIAEHHGRIVKTTGDGTLVEFASVVDSVRCAVEMQQAIPQRNAGVAADSRIELRIGINLGDVIVEPDDIYGDGVNIAARLEALADAGGVFVSNTVYDQIRDRLPFIFEDLGEQQVKNIARSVRVYRVRDAGAAKRKSAPAAAVLPLPDKPSIAVLPFQNMSGDPEQDYFVDGMVEEIITALSRIRWLFVIARNSSFTYKGQAVDVKQVGRELGVRYVLEGSVRKASNRVRITGQLIEAASDAHLWADRFDGSLEDVFELQDKVAISVAGVIEPTLQAAEIRRSSERPTSDLTAYDLYLRALPGAMSGEKNGYIEALDLLGRSIERDPHYGPILALAAVCHAAMHVSGWTLNPNASRREGIARARQALRYGGDDACTLARAAYALALFGEDIEAAIALVDRSLQINPSFAYGWQRSGWLRLWAGNPDLAISHLETALRLNPRDPSPATLMGIGVGHFFARRLEEARSMLLRSLQEQPGWVPTSRFLAACTRIWVDWTKREQLSSSCEFLRPWWCRMPRIGAIPSIANSIFRASVWRRARRNDHHPPSRCNPRRRCGGIFAADGGGRGGTHERLKALRRELLDPKIAEHHGRIVKTTGDGLLVEFASVVDSVRCAVEMQQAIPERNASVAADSRIELRIGINLGDVILDDDDIFGDSVNVAARPSASHQALRRGGVSDRPHIGSGRSTTIPTLCGRQFFH